MTTPTGSGGTPGSPGYGPGASGGSSDPGAGTGGSPAYGSGSGTSGSSGGGVPTSGAPQVGARPSEPSGPPRDPSPLPGGGGTPGPARTAGPATGRSGRPGGGAAAAQPLRPGKARRARLVVRRVDPWSVLKFTLLFSLCLLIVFVVAVSALFYALDAMGVFEKVNDVVRDLTQTNSGGRRTGGVEVPFTASRVIGVATVIGLINVVLITAISTLGAFLYNLCSDIVGGIEVTLAERD